MHIGRVGSVQGIGAYRGMGVHGKEGGQVRWGSSTGAAVTHTLHSGVGFYDVLFHLVSIFLQLLNEL